MAATCPVHFDVSRLRGEVRATYTRVATDPEGDFHFHRGARYAVEYLGYDARELAELPARATARFAGVGNPFAMGPIGRGEVVLDHACGAGMDLLLAARRVGPTGRALGVDMTAAMADAARRAALEAGLEGRVEVHEGMYEALPIASASIDVVLSNGVVNLAPDKRIVFREIARVLRPGGRLHLADVVVQRELTMAVRQDADLWAACIGGALTEHELAELAREAGLTDTEIQRRYLSFAGTSAGAKVSGDLHVSAVNFFARKPE